SVSEKFSDFFVAVPASPAVIWRARGGLIMVRDVVGPQVIGVGIGIESLETRTLFASPHSAPIDPVIEWNNVLIDALRADRTLPGPGYSSRSGAIVQGAILDS